MMSRYLTATHKEKAEIERDLWASITMHERQVTFGGKDYRYIQTFFPEESSRKISLRRSLRNAGPLCADLWPALDAGHITVSKAYEIVKFARRESADVAVQCVTVERVLAHYFTTGKIGLPPKTKKHANGAACNAAADLITDYLKEKLTDDDALEQLAREIRFDVAEIFEEYRKRVQTLNARAAVGMLPNSCVTRFRVRRAFDTLGLDAPQPADEINMAIIAKQKRKLARKYHPDLTGNEDLRDAYEAVIEAYQTIEQYKEENHV